jgi:drug/metabolite transporter (DMT)-like permease
MNIFARKYLREYDAFDVASVRMFAAVLVAMPLSILIAGFDLNQVNQQGYLALVYAALFGTFLGMLLAFYNIKRFGATPAAMTLYVVPVIATIGGVLVLGEQITTGMLGGMIMIILGIATLNQRVPRASIPKPY